MISTLNGWSVQRYGGPETLTQVARPLAPPTADQVMLRIKASAVTRADTMMRRGEPRWARAFLGFRRPRKDLSGVCLSGEVVAVGSNVTRFSVGDDVVGEAGLNVGANANHICLDANSVLLHTALMAIPIVSRCTRAKIYLVFLAPLLTGSCFIAVGWHCID